MQKTSETKVLRDPVHGYIHVDLQVVWDCINARARWFTSTILLIKRLIC